MALLLILLLAAATVFLIRNMNQRLRRLPETFDSASMSDGARTDTPVTPDPRRPQTRAVAPHVRSDRGHGWAGGSRARRTDSIAGPVQPR